VTGEDRKNVFVRSKWSSGQMRNRAKCRLCEEIIESFHSHDYVSCKCGEISIDGGNMHYKASAKDFNNFLRVDDNGKEVEVVVEEKAPIEDLPSFKPSKEELLQMLEEMQKRIENLPIEAIYSPINHADFASLMMLLSAIFRSE